jgi:mannan endo-1,4-beta-mannosidase
VIRVLVAAAIVVAVAVGARLLAGPNGRDAAFRVDRTQIRDGEGHVFVPVGMNLVGPNGFFNGAARTSGLAGVVRDDWDLNTVRLNMCLPRGCGYTGVVNEHNDDLDALVEQFTSRHVVVVLALHQVAPGSMPSGRELSAIDGWWHQQAEHFKRNPYVWFNLLNEPGHGKPPPPSWLSMHERLLTTVRAAGAENIVMVDASNWGQEVGGVDSGNVPTENSSLLRWGPTLARQFDNVVFSLHVYDEWGVPRDDAARDARLADFIDRVHAAGLALVLGEVGGGASPCCDPRSLATASAYRVAPRRGVGIIAWHGQAVDGFKLVRTTGASSPDAIDDPDHPTNLTWQGELLWDLAHR